MRIEGFNHFQLDAMDVERTRAYYESLGGVTTQQMVRDRPAGWKGYHVKLADNCTVEIQPPRFADQCGGWNGWDHICLLVEDVAAAAAAFEKAGAIIEKPVSKVTVGGKERINCVTIGPDGEKIELISDDVPATGNYRIIKTDHIKLNSNAEDVEKAKDFYVNGLEGKITAELFDKQGNKNGYMVEVAPDTVLEIQPPRFPFNGKNSAWNTIAVTVLDTAKGIEGFVAAGGTHEVGPFKGTMGTINIINSVEIGPVGEHFEFIQVI